MKKLFVILLLLFINYSGYSQVSFGAKSGINIATTKNLIAYPKNRIGWYAGGFATIPFRKKFFLQPELLYSSKGHRAIIDYSQIQLPDFKSSIRLNYLNALILLGYHIDHKTSLAFGPELGYLTSTHMVIDDNENFNVSKNYPTKFDAGFDVEINYKIVNTVGIEALYHYGFNTLYSTDAVGNRSNQTKGANRVFQIGLNYIF